jgi:hypothetical protein
MIAELLPRTNRAVPYLGYIANILQATSLEDGGVIRFFIRKGVRGGGRIEEMEARTTITGRDSRIKDTKGEVRK